MKLVLLALCWALYFGIHSFLAGEEAKAWFGRTFPLVNSYYRLIYNVLAVALLIPILYFQFLLESKPLLPSTYVFSIPGIALMAISVLLGGIALMGYNLGEFSGLAYVEGKNTKGKLKTTGLNAWVRHPLYFALFLFLWGLVLWQGTDVSLTVAAVGTAYLFVGSRSEEKKMIRAFGEEYKAYQKRVKMLIPFIY